MLCPIPMTLRFNQEYGDFVCALLFIRTSSSREIHRFLEEDDLVFAMVLSATILCQAFVEHLCMEPAQFQFSIFFHRNRKGYVVFVFAKEADHASSLLGRYPSSLLLVILLLQRCITREAHDPVHHCQPACIVTTVTIKL